MDEKANHKPQAPAKDEAAAAPKPRKVTLLGLLAATYLMVSGGPYGLEDIVQAAGYGLAVVALLVVPLIWSVPTALMVSELSSALPEEGGYYVWVRRALGPFWGLQEAWLSLAASIFDMAIYPILFVTYLGFVGKTVEGWQLAPRGTAGLFIGLAMVAGCALANLRTPRSLGRSALIMTAVMLGPFVVLSVLGFAHPAVAVPDADPAATGKAPDYVMAILFALWNYMGWDNATTFANDVDRPQRTYPLAMGGAAILVTLTYVIPVWASSRTGIAPSDWDTGTWVTVGRTVGGVTLAVAIGVGGMVAAFGTFNSLVLSYSRLPVVLAEDGYLPGAFRRRLRTGAPWVSVVVCAIAWGLATQLGLKRVLALDVMLYGLSLLLEFAAFVALRLREPGLPRPFRVPGGTVGAALLAVGPALLIGLAIYDQAGKWVPEPDEPMSPGAAVVLGACLTALGPIFYLPRWLRRRQSTIR